MIDAVQAPTLIYKKAPLPSDELLLELADNPHVVGIKYAENQMDKFRTTVQKDGGRIEWLCGSAERFAPFYMLAGSSGYTTGAGNICPHLTLAMHAAFTAGEYEEGMRLQAIEAAGVPVRQVYRGDRLKTRGDCTIEVLFPPEFGVLGGARGFDLFNDNANSIVLSIEYQGRRVLLPGDLESPGLDEVIAEPPLPCDVLMVPHHGSPRSNPPGFAAWRTPQWVVVSGGDWRDVDVVREAYAAQGATLLHTDDVGAVRFGITRDEVRVDYWRD